ncbi:MAG TPA: Npt1/Npt2 family nucleotide transporter [Vicinamibacterales bacterium]|nr:Npt1/Npt2 family nucleotide transporter [Vicinamibacterales bacterium]
MSVPSSSGSLTARLLRPFAQVRNQEGATALLMFLYSFLALTSYNIIQPITRSKFISDLGAENIPYIQFVSGLIIGALMQGYVKATALLPRRWVIPVSQAAIVVVLVAFWVLFQTGAEWVSAAFYLLGLIFAILLVSQFWALANAIYDARQAKRLFGFIGGGTALGGMMGAGITTLIAERVGTENLILWSAATLALCIAIVALVLRREAHAVAEPLIGAEAESVRTGEALRLLITSRHVRLIATVITFGALGAAILDQQLNMATQEFMGRGETDAITAFLGAVRFWLSAAAFVIQVFLTSRIHRFLGVGFALMVLPVNLAVMAGVIIAIPALWAPALGSVVDRSFRYTVDKTTREILFLPLPLDIKLVAKPVIDVTVDRMAKGVGALILIVLIKPWGLGLRWDQLSYVTLLLVAAWLVMAVYAKREYVRSFLRSLEQRGVQPAEIRLGTADLNTIETLVAELSHPDPRRVVYAVDLLESLDKRHLVTPLLLYHEAPEVRARALRVAEAAGAAAGDRWVTGIERVMHADADADVRLAAVRALAAVRREAAAAMVRPYLTDSDPRLVVTAAAALGAGEDEDDIEAAADALSRLSADTREQAASARLEVARALGRLPGPRFGGLLISLLFDPNLAVAREALRSAGQRGAGDFLLVPPLVSLLRNRLLKREARQVLVGYGEAVVDALAYFLLDRDEDPWVRRHVPGTLSQIPSARTVAALVEALDDPDGFLRYKALSALDRIRRSHPALSVPPAVVERFVLTETTRAFSALTLHYNLFVSGGLDRGCLLARALEEKHRRALNRTYRLLGLIHPPTDIAAVQATLEQGDVRARSGAAEYLDNLLAGDVRRRVMLLAEDLPLDERIRKGNVLFRTRSRDVEDTLAQLVHDEDQVIASAAIQVVERQGLWSLSGDLEHALAHRDVRDWYVLEASSWALAAARMSQERRRTLWLEPLPAVELADRLRRIRLFDFASVDELFRVAGLGRQVRHESGRLLYERGRAPESLQFLLDGRLEATWEDETRQTIDAPATAAFEEVLEGRAMRSTIRAVDTAITQSLTTEEVLSLLSENVELAQGIFRLLIETGCGPSWRTVVHGHLTEEIKDKVRAGLPPVDRWLLLQSSPLLARATAAELLQLAASAKFVPLKTGTDLFAPGSSPAIFTVLEGTVRVTIEGEEHDTAHSGDVIGMYETLSGQHLPGHAVVTAEGSALRFDRMELFDLLADHVEMLQGLFSGLLNARAKVRNVGPHVDTG